MAGGDIQQRVEAVRQRVDVAALIGAAAGWPRGRKRGKCPFHGSKSDSLAVYPDSGKAKCWGCPWHGDALQFVMDFHGLDFIGALERLEAELGLDESGRRPSAEGAASGSRAALRTQKVERAWRGPEVVDSAVVARHLWAAAVADADSLRVWLRARNVPEAMLGDPWFGQLRFCAAAPISAWATDKDHTSVHQAPAMVGLIRRVVDRDAVRSLMTCGVHATYLSPGLRAKMNRRRADGSAVAARKMYGDAAGGFVVLGTYRRDCPLYVGEGIETVLSGMALCHAGEEACGLAVLSLGNLQGAARGRNFGQLRGVLPLFNVQPDPVRPAVCFQHDGPVTGLIDADMKVLRGMRDPASGEFRGLPVQERPGGPVVWRAISSRERAEICATLFTLAWRAAGCRQVRAIRPAMGMDFNDLAQAGRVGASA